jgi:predicted RNase H-like nuclease (RuvC/YqgF family)
MSTEKKRASRNSTKAMDKLDKTSTKDEPSHQEMWELMQSIKSDTESTINRLNAMEHKITVLETQVSGIGNLSADVKALQSTVSLLCTKLTGSEITVSRLSREVVELKARSMKHKLSFNFDRNTIMCMEVEGDDCFGVIKRFLSNVMSVPNSKKMYVPVAYLLGKLSISTTPMMQTQS